MIHGFGLDVLFGIPEKQSKRHDTAGNCATDFASAEAGERGHGFENAAIPEYKDIAQRSK